MAIITRPIKLGGGTDYVPGNDELAEEFNGDANTIYNDYNGNIKNVNCASDMGLEGTKLADAPLGIPTVKLNDKSVTGAKIANDTTIDGNRAIGVDHIKLNSVPSGRLKGLVIESVAFNYDFGAGHDPYIAYSARFITGSVYTGKVVVVAQNFASKNLVRNTLTVTPLTNIPTATKDLIAMYIDNIVITFAGTTISGNLIFVSVDKA